MIFNQIPLKDAYVIEIEPHQDNRGYFERLICRNEMMGIGLTKEIVQINHSFSKQKGTLRGMHYQVPPFTETRIIKCIKGSVFDVAIDIRKESPTFLKWFGLELTEGNNRMLFIPEGFAHGFQTLKNNSELLYFHTGYYNPQAEAAINYSDPLLKIKFPLKVTEISDRDKSHTFITDPHKELPDFKYYL
jgi:dTDP-4-dehydrorhamnose 3,5-epimerase